MKTILLISLVLFSSLCLTAVIQAVAVSNEDRNNEASMQENVGPEKTVTKTEEDKISDIERQVLSLQESVAEITRSFSTLELVSRNPSMMAKLHIPDTLETEKALKVDKKRLRREVDSSSTLPTSFPSSGVQQTYYGRNELGPYSWPLFSGQCFLCPAGVPGPRGPPGPQGIAGRDGRDGRDSQTSPQAQETPTSPSDPTNTGSRSRGDGIVRPVSNTTSSLPGVIYIRWGHDECPEGAQLIYSGTIGGAMYTHTGSGANHLCMPDEPIYDEVETSLHAERALLYSSEYQTSAAVERLQSLHDQTPSCAVCRAPSGRTTKLMIPARNVCPSEEWRLEYAGYLMAEKYTHKRSEFVCVDREMVPKPGSHGNQNGVLLYMVEARCLVGGGLPCGPYTDGYELTCAVCTM